MFIKEDYKNIFLSHISLKIISLHSSAINAFFMILLFVGLFLSTSCNKTGIDGRHPLFVKGQKCFEKGEYTDATKFYERYLKINPGSAKTNYRLAVIYQEQGKYIKAIFYYEKYLALEPNSSDREIIEKWISSSKEQLLRKLEKIYTGTRKKIKKVAIPKNDCEKELLKELNHLKAKNKEMRSFILRHKDSILESNKFLELGKPLSLKLNNTASRNKNKPAYTYSETVKKTDTNKITNPMKVYSTAKKNKGVLTYTIEPGDTLYGISKKFYGTVKFYKFIVKNNRNQLNASTKLIPGNKLIILPKAENQEL
jgi:tetratricopeptide (TPR) repeat protein